MSIALSILGAALVLFALAVLGIKVGDLTAEINALKIKLGNEPTKRDASLAREQQTRSEQFKALRGRVRLAEWKIRQLARGEKIPS